MKSIALGNGLIIAAMLACLAGCSSHPTYPKERLVESMQRLFAEEHLNTEVRLIDRTLAVHLDYPESLTQSGTQIRFGPAFDESVRKALMVIHRVILSSDANVQFYVILVSDPKSPGAYITIVRYMDDVKRINANMLDTFEMFARTIFEANYVGNGSLSLDRYIPREIHMDEFLSWQIARRIQNKLTEDFGAKGLADVGRCSGEFRNGEFMFTLNVSPFSPSGLSDEMLRKIFKISTTQIAQVLSNYKFDSFDAVRLIHPATGRNLVFPKARLEVFR